MFYFIARSGKVNVDVFWNLLELHGVKLSSSEKKQSCFQTQTSNQSETDRTLVINYKAALKNLIIDMSSAREGDERWIVTKNNSKTN